MRRFCISEFFFFFTPPLPHSSSTAGFTGAAEHHLQPAPAAGQQGARHRAQRLPVQEERRVGAQINSHRLQFVCFSVCICARNLPGDFCHPARQLKNDRNCCSVGGVNRTLRLVQAFSDSDWLSRPPPPVSHLCMKNSDWSNLSETEKVVGFSFVCFYNRRMFSVFFPPQHTKRCCGLTRAPPCVSG